MTKRTAMRIDMIRCVGPRSALWQHATRPGIFAYVDGAKVTWRPSSGWKCRDCGTACVHIEALIRVVAEGVTNPISEERNPA